MFEPVTMTRSASAVAPGAGAPVSGDAALPANCWPGPCRFAPVGPCAKTCAIAKKGSTTLNTKAARDNPDLLFVLMSFSMVWLGLVLGNINIFRGDKLFFHFFENFFERPGRAICLCLVRSGRFRSRLRAGLRVFVCASEGEIPCLRSDDQEPPTGTYPGWEVWSYILYKYTPILTPV